jgi:superfamily II DNA or RNA helicase/diadenosine tetraphosphate (Ap4A) HIT family hydrolase
MSEEPGIYQHPHQCPFCTPDLARVFLATELVLGLWDGFPVSAGHALLITRRHVADWFQATADEQAALTTAISQARTLIEERATREGRPKPDGYNVGFNAGAAAGQTVFHLHVHVIPRHAGDVADPRGGIRNVIPGKANYLVRDDAGEYRRPGHVDDVRLTTGPDVPLLGHLLADIDRSQRVDIAVAFVMTSGVALLFEHLRDVLERDGQLRLLTGDYMGVTDPQALLRLLDLPREPELRVYETRPGNGFHLKSYICHFADGGGAAYVGSSNLSRSALLESVEWNFRVFPSVDAVGFREAEIAFDSLYRHSSTTDISPRWVSDYRARRPQAGGVVTGMPPEAPTEIPKPHHVQHLALQALAKTREQGNTAGLVVLATGLGKTWLSAFDSDKPGHFDRVLFVAHRDEILAQALGTFRRIRPDASLGFYTGTQKDAHADVLFASIQTLGRLPHLRNFAPDAFDYIVVDEFHHAAAASYRKLLEYFQPKFLLGLTATPDRTDGGDLLGLCQENLIYRCDLFEGIHKGLLSPFHYYGVPDNVDYENIPWRGTRFDPEKLTTAVATRARAENILAEYRRLAGQRTLAFCCSVVHADFMATYFRAQGIATAAVHSAPSSAPRAQSLENLANGTISVVFAVDILNEGVDIPAVDTVMLLRPTESSILWTQQVGRGLRRAEGKSHLTIIDYIGNHKSFLNKVRSVLQIGSGVTELRSAVAQLRVGDFDLPPGCELTYELEAIEILEGLLPPARTNALHWYYQDYKERIGSRPTASEALHDGYNPRATGAVSWLEFVDSNEDLEPAQQEVLGRHRDFLAALESTPMTKSYKMVVLLAMLNESQLPGSIDMGRLVEAVRRIVNRSAALQADFGDKRNDATELQTLLKNNPIAAWVDGAGTGQTSYFSFENGYFNALVDEPLATREVLQGLIRELVEWRLADYLRRAIGAETDKDFVCKIIQSGGQPFVKLPDRVRVPEIPEGWTPVRINGAIHEANFVKIAINVIRLPGADDNLLPEIVRGWFGSDAGQSGTDYRVRIRQSGSDWVMEPIGAKGNVEGPELWRRYSREQIPPLFGQEFSTSRWNQGFVVLPKDVILLVTLDKSDLNKDHAYKDYFESPDTFHWQSQNRTTQASAHGQIISAHVEKGVGIHLFVREQKRQEGQVGGFVYCGPVLFRDWQGEKPISVVWRLRDPLSASLWGKFGGRSDA